MHSTKRDAVLVVVFLSVVACQRRDAPTASTAADHSGTPASDHTGHTLVATASGNSSAMGTWRPGRFDSCTAAVHDQFAVTGPDGKRYPTWHP
ncbi:MAG: hypothetical protein IT358_01155, partial [Gemmatimonadaceae bacterium]|nr:hypothetical protein [Gemmatimonadaceae bacterium]